MQLQQQFEEVRVYNAKFDEILSAREANRGQHCKKREKAPVTARKTKTDSTSEVNV